MGAALYWFTPVVAPYLTGSVARRATGLFALVGAGVAIYAMACFLTGAFALDDVKLLIKRRAKEA